MMRQLFALLLLVLCPLTLLAGKQAHHWYFGDRAGLDFSTGMPVAVTDGAMFAAEGCASISDRDGNLLFYTDGITVWNRNHTVMRNGTGLHGAVSTTQPVLIVPRPGSIREYYIFTVDQAGGGNGLQYSVVDMQTAGGPGEVIAKNTELVAPVAEKITAVRHSNGTDVWVLVHGWNNATLYAWLVTAAGVQSSPVASTVGSFHGGEESNAIGTMKLSGRGDKLVVTVPQVSSFEVFDFDASTGVVSNPLLFPPQYPAYGTEFSPDGSLLYVGVTGLNRGIYQFNLEAGSDADIIASGQRVDAIESGFAGALQLAPDGAIYVARLAEGFVGAITDPDTRGLACTYVDQYVSLNGRSGRLGLPGFIQSDIDIPGQFSVEHTCFGAATVFRSVIKGKVDSVAWDFGDPASGAANTSNNREPVHIFTAPGQYFIMMSVYLNGEKRSIRRPVDIRPAPQISFEADTLELCAGALLAPVGGSGQEIFLWSTGETGATISVPGSGRYWVSVSNGECETRDSVVVREKVLSLIVPFDTVSVCSGGRVALQAGGAATYEWVPAAGLDDPFSATPVAGPAVSTLYTVRGRTAEGCEAERQVLVRVLPDDALQFGVPDTAAVVGTENFSLPVYIRIPSELLPLHIPVLTIELDVDPMAFQPEAVSVGVMQQTQQRVTIQLHNVHVTAREQVLTIVQGLVLAGGDSPVTPLRLHNVTSGECVQSNLRHGSLALQGCALEQRYVGFGTSVRLSAAPNPATDDVTLDVVTSLHDTYRLVLFTATGQALWQQQFTGAGTGEEHYHFRIDRQTLVPGVYYAVLFSSGSAVCVGITVMQ